MTFQILIFSLEITITRPQIDWSWSFTLYVLLNVICTVICASLAPVHCFTVSGPSGIVFFQPDKDLVSSSLRTLVITCRQWPECCVFFLRQSFHRLLSFTLTLSLSLFSYLLRDITVWLCSITTYIFFSFSELLIHHGRLVSCGHINSFVVIT